MLLDVLLRRFGMEALWFLANFQRSLGRLCKFHTRTVMDIFRRVAVAFSYSVLLCYQIDAVGTNTVLLLPS